LFRLARHSARGAVSDALEIYKSVGLTSGLKATDNGIFQSRAIQGRSRAQEGSISMYTKLPVSKDIATGSLPEQMIKAWRFGTLDATSLPRTATHGSRRAGSPGQHRCSRDLRKPI